MSKILVTGGAGQIGASLCAKLVENPDNFVVVVDNLTTGRQDKLPSRSFANWRFIRADVNAYSDIAPIFASHVFDFVFHYAAVVGVKRTLENPKMVLNDIDGIRNILDLSKNTGVRRVFYSSSSEVYGEPVEIPQVEDTTPLNSRLPYAIVKNVGEAFCKSYRQEFGLDYTIFRFFNTYGPLQTTDFVVLRFLQAAFEGRELTIYGDGLQTRTFCYIDDNIDATLTALNENLFVNDVVNVGSDQEITIIDLAKLIIDITGSKSEIKYLPPLEDGDMRRRMPDTSKMRQLLRRGPTSLNVGLRKVLESWASKHQG